MPTAPAESTAASAPSPSRARLIFCVHEILWVNGRYTFEPRGCNPRCKATSAHDLGCNRNRGRGLPPSRSLDWQRIALCELALMPIGIDRGDRAGRIQLYDLLG